MEVVVSEEPRCSEDNPLGLLLKAGRFGVATRKIWKECQEQQEGSGCRSNKEEANLQNVFQSRDAKDLGPPVGEL